MEPQIDTMLNYLLEGTVILLLVLLVYRVLLFQTKYFQFNRFFLLGGAILGGTLPLVDLSVPVVPAVLPIFDFEPFAVQATALEINPAFSWNALILISYGTGVGLAMILFLIRLFRLFKFLHSSVPVDTYKGVPIYPLHKGSGPGSFLGKIFLDLSEAKGTYRANILRHEYCHVRQWHTVDVLLLELLKIVAWFHPLVYFFDQEIRLQHEYIADAAVTEEESIPVYTRSLLDHIVPGLLPLGNSFYYSPIKRRIMMMRKVNGKHSVLKILVGLLILITGCIGITSQEITVEYAQDDQRDDILQLEEVYQLGVPINQEPDIKKYIHADIAPAPLNMEEVQKAIGYPEHARKEGIEGAVVVRVLVGQNGEYKKHQVIASPHSILSHAVEQNIQQLAFSPAMHDNESVQFWVNIPFKFKLLEMNLKAQKNGPFSSTPLNMNEVMKAVGYPQIARDAGIEGKVLVRVTIGTDGTYKSHEVIESPHAILLRAVENQITELKYKPLEKEGKPIEFVVNVPFNFELLG